MGMEEAIRVIKFNGKKDDWPYWKGQFLARASRKGFKDILTGKATVLGDTAIKKISDDKKREAQEKIAALNITAYEELVLSMDIKETSGKIAYRLVESSKDTTFP